MKTHTVSLVRQNEELKRELQLFRSRTRAHLNNIDKAVRRMATFPVSCGFRTGNGRDSEDTVDVGVDRSVDESTRVSTL